MIVALIISLVLDGAWLVHFIAHHRTGIAMAAVGAVGWLGARTGIPLLASHTGGHRPSSRKARKALRRAMKQARKAVTA